MPRGDLVAIGHARLLETTQFLSIDVELTRSNLRRMNEFLASAGTKFGASVDLHGHFLRGDRSWLTSIIEPSLRGASEVRCC